MRRANITTHPRYDGSWAIRAGLLGSLFAFIILIELAVLGIFVVVLTTGLMDPSNHHWLGTLIAVLPLGGLSYLLPRQLGFMYSELAGGYTISVSDDQIIVRPSRFQTGAPKPVRRSHQTFVYLGRFLPMIEIVMIQDDGRLVFGSTLPAEEQRRVLHEIVAALEATRSYTPMTS